MVFAVTGPFPKQPSARPRRNRRADRSQGLLKNATTPERCIRDRPPRANGTATPFDQPTPFDQSTLSDQPSRNCLALLVWCLNRRHGTAGDHLVYTVSPPASCKGTAGGSLRHLAAPPHLTWPMPCNRRWSRCIRSPWNWAGPEWPDKNPRTPMEALSVNRCPSGPGELGEVGPTTRS